MVKTNPTPMIQLEGVSKSFGDVQALKHIDATINEGEFFSLLGPSGCGKTTLLRMIAGFEEPTSGQILIDGEDVASVPPNRRPVNMVFQSYAVFPHMKVFDNVAYGLKVTGVDKGEIRERVQEALGLVQLTGFENREPDQLSGGQRQRVALARALVTRPALLLADEPTGNLDSKTGKGIVDLLYKLRTERGVTIVSATHDHRMIDVSDRVVYLRDGRIEKIANREDIDVQVGSMEDEEGSAK